MADQIAEAIAATPAPSARAGVLVRTSTGREFAINAPLDMNGQDALDLVGYIATRQLETELSKHRRRGPQLVAVRGTIPKA
jgi:hypothetical protein